MKRVVALIICMAMMVVSFPITTYASESIQSEDDKNIKDVMGEATGYLAANMKYLQITKAEAKFTSPTGHGFAAERGNNLSDVFHGKNSTVVGDNNVKNGADRLVINRDGSKIWIQDKYYKTAAEGVNACFDENGMFRYLDADNKPMKIEVPSDQYDDAVAKMAEKIKQGKVPNVTDPAEASNIIKKGKLTYKQAVNITKAGNIDSLKYDAGNGVITASAAVGITFMIDYAICLMNGDDCVEALKTASMNGLKTGSVVFCTYVISSQLTKSGMEKALVPSSEAVAKALGKKASESILRTNGMNAATSASRVTQVANVLRNEAIFSTVTVVVLSTGDVIDVFRGRISTEQLLSNLSVTTAGVAGGVAGKYVGGAIGTAICPGIGTTIGAFIGGAVVAFGSSYAANEISGKIYEGDAQKMYDILVAEFQNLAVDYLVNEKEAESVVDNMKDVLTEKNLKDMYAASDRNAFARSLIEPLFEKQVALRENIKTPSLDEVRAELKVNLQGVALVH